MFFNTLQVSNPFENKFFLKPFRLKYYPVCSIVHVVLIMPKVELDFSSFFEKKTFFASSTCDILLSQIFKARCGSDIFEF